MRPSFCGSPPSPAPENWCDSGDVCDCGGCARPGDALDGTSDGCAGPGDALDATTGDDCAGPGDALDVHTGDGCANSGDARDGIGDGCYLNGDGCDGIGDILDRTDDGCNGTSDVLDGTGNFCDGIIDVLNGAGDGTGDVLDVTGDGCAGPGDVLDGNGAGSCHTSPSSGGICASDKLGPGDGVSLPHAAGSNPAKASRGCSQVTSRVYDRRPDTRKTPCNSHSGGCCRCSRKSKPVPSAQISAPASHGESQASEMGAVAGTVPYRTAFGKATTCPACHSPLPTR